MSSITDWLADYTGADTNTPASATSIPNPANNTTDLGYVIRDIKKVAREESFNKAWEADALNATYVASAFFTLVGNTTNTYPIGTAVKCNLNGTYSYAQVVNAAYVAPNTTIAISPGTVNAALTTVTFGAFKPSSNPPRKDLGYAYGKGSSLPGHVSQIGQFDSYATATSQDCRFARGEYDADYLLLFQAISASGGTPAIDSYRITAVTKSATSFSVNFAAAPGGTTRVRWEFCVVRPV